MHQNLFVIDYQWFKMLVTVERNNKQKVVTIWLEVSVVEEDTPSKEPFCRPPSLSSVRALQDAPHSSPSQISHD